MRARGGRVGGAVGLAFALVASCTPLGPRGTGHPVDPRAPDHVHRIPDEATWRLVASGPDDHVIACSSLDGTPPTRLLDLADGRRLCRVKLEGSQAPRRRAQGVGGATPLRG